MWGPTITRPPPCPAIFHGPTHGEPYNNYIANNSIMNVTQKLCMDAKQHMGMN